MRRRDLRIGFTFGVKPALVLLAVALLAAACGGGSDAIAPPGAPGSSTGASGLPADLLFLGSLAAEPARITATFDDAGGDVELPDGSRVSASVGAFTAPTNVAVTIVDLELENFVTNAGTGAVYRLSTADDVTLTSPVILEIAKPADSVFVTQRVDGAWSAVTVPPGPTTKVEIRHFSEVTTSVIDRPDPATTAVEPAPDGLVPAVFLDSCVLMFVGAGDDGFLNNLALSVCTQALIEALTPPGESKVEVGCVGDRIGGDVDIRGAIALCIADRAPAEQSASGTPSDATADEGAPVAPAPASAEAPTVLDSIPDGTYFGTLGNFEFRNSITVIDSGASLLKQGNTIEWEWSVQWEQALVECAYQNRDSWGGAEIINADATILQISGTRTFEVDLISTCPNPSGDIASSFERAMTLSLDGTQLSGNIGIGTVTFDLSAPG